MAKKAMYSEEAERRYVVDQMTIAEIASRLSLSEKTVWTWKEEGEWDKKRRQHLEQKEAFHQELYAFARALLRGITEDMAAGEKVDTGRLYTLTRLLPMLVKVKDFEDAIKTAEPKEGKARITEDVVKLIEREVLGLGE
ncbi:MAG: hypothetical protein C4529_08935 [Deltaproteobacteria bacterium]|nr:MAG: hypothetical protein C4529_08935 [Deltaproteobacteria bacterium]